MAQWQKSRHRRVCICIGGWLAQSSPEMKSDGNEDVSLQTARHVRVSVYAVNPPGICGVVLRLSQPRNQEKNGKSLDILGLGRMAVKR